MKFLKNLNMIVEEAPLVKVVIVGDSDVGKTCLLLRYIEKKFIEFPLSTIGVDFKTQMVSVDGIKVKLQIWDTAGKERFRTITKAYYRGMHVLLIIVDVSSADFKKSANYWINTVAEQGMEGHTEVVLVGNKCDKEERIPKNVAENFALENGLHYFEISVKDDVGIDNVFNYISTVAYHLQMTQKRQKK